MPQVSVIIPVYNAEKYLEECLDSVLGQTLWDIEIICIDDGSSDNSWEILKRYVRKDERIRLLQQKNQGAGVARNKGLTIAQGEYLTFFDSDDVFEKNMLAQLYMRAKEHDLDIVVCRADGFDNNSKKIRKMPYSIRWELLPEQKIFRGRDVKKDFFRLFVWWPWDKLYKKKHLDSLKLQFQDLRTTNDLYFVSMAVLLANRIECINDVLVHQRQNVKTSLSVTREKSWDCFYFALLKVKSFLIDNNLYKRYEQDFVNYSLDFSLWHLETMKGNSYCLLYNALREELFMGLGITEHGEEYFYNKNNYKMLNYILTTNLEQHMHQKTLIKASIGKKNRMKRLAEQAGNMYMRVKLYYKGYGFVNTVKKIIEKI